MGHRRIAEEARWLPELFDSHQWERLAGRFELTDRQCAIARLLCRGLTNREIAAALRVSDNTVRTHVRNLFRQLGVRDRVGVVVTLVVTCRNAIRKGEEL